MPSSPDARIIEYFVRQVSASADPQHIGRAASETWTRIGVSLSPIVGNNGMKALYARSVFMTARRFPRLASVPDDASLGDSLADLTRLLSGLAADEAHAIALALFREFHDLMSSMVGPILTTELIGSFWDLPERDNHVPVTE